MKKTEAPKSLYGLDIELLKQLGLDGQIQNTVTKSEALAEEDDLGNMTIDQMRARFGEFDSEKKHVSKLRNRCREYSDIEPKEEKRPQDDYDSGYENN